MELEATRGPQSLFFSKKCSENGQDSKLIVPWVEKYRPRSVSEIAAQDEVCRLFRCVLDTGELPNLLFYGPPGTGKTSSILALARDLFGSENLRSRVLELNASDERGIQVIRDKVKTFSQQSVASIRNPRTNAALPPYKIILLDEADNLTSSAQAALRRIMELQMRTTRFCLICNYVTKLIEPITSRCSKFYFRPLSPEQCLTRLSEICQKEGITVSPECLSALIHYSEGDLRKAVMYLQSCHYTLSSNRRVAVENVRDICGILPQEYFDRLLRLCREHNFDGLIILSKELANEGYSASKFIAQLHDQVLVWDHLEDAAKARIFLKLSVAPTLRAIPAPISPPTGGRQNARRRRRRATPTALPHDSHTRTAQGVIGHVP